MSPSELIDLIIDRAPKLRSAGVRSLQLPGAISIALDPPDDEPRTLLPIGFDDIPPDPEPDPLEDPITYGTERAPGYEFDFENDE